VKADKEIVGVMIDNLQGNLENFVDEIKYHIKCLKRARSVEEVMMIKRDILRAWVAYMPLSSGTCYFCIAHEKESGRIDCEECEYAKYHGICEDKNSSWMKSNNLRWKFSELIHKEYYKGEKYEQETD